jgi:hypothetical protein
MYTHDQFRLGSRIWFPYQKRPYKVAAMNERFMICMKPFNLEKTYLYTIISFEEQVRGTHNMIFNCYDFATPSHLRKCLIDLTKGELKVSHRNRVDLSITRIETK